MIVAVDRFLRDTAPPPASGSASAPARSPWTRAARLEGVGRELDDATPWDDRHPWGLTPGGPPPA